MDNTLNILIIETERERNYFKDPDATGQVFDFILLLNNPNVDSLRHIVQECHFTTLQISISDYILNNSASYERVKNLILNNYIHDTTLQLSTFFTSYYMFY